MLAASDGSGSVREPRVEHLVRDLRARQAQAHHEHVRVVPLARAGRGLGVGAQRGAHAGDLVGGDRRAGAGPAEQHAGLGVAPVATDSPTRRPTSAHSCGPRRPAARPARPRRRAPRDRRRTASVRAVRSSDPSTTLTPGRLRADPRARMPWATTSRSRALAASSSLAPFLSVSSNVSIAADSAVVTEAACTFTPALANETLSVWRSPGWSAASTTHRVCHGEPWSSNVSTARGSGRAVNFERSSSRRRCSSTAASGGGSLTRYDDNAVLSPQVTASARVTLHCASCSARVTHAIRPRRSRATTSTR